jgi:hypothetical protein
MTVDRADLDLLHHVGFLAQLAVWEKVGRNPGTRRRFQVGSEALIPDVVRRVLVRSQ